MPMIAAAAVAVFATATAVTTAFATIGAITVFGVSLATIATVGLAVSTLIAAVTLSSSFKKPATQEQGQQLQIKLDPHAPVPVIYGRTASSGYTTYKKTGGGSKNPYLWAIAVLSVGPIHSIESATYDDLKLSYSGSPSSGYATVTSTTPGSATAKTFLNGKLKLHWNVGPTVNTPVVTRLGETPPGMTSASCGHSLAHAISRFDYDTEAFPSGEPRKQIFVARGRKVYDPRKDSTYAGGSGSHRRSDPSTWEWSENPYLCALDWTLGYWVNGRLMYGIGAPISAVDVAGFVAAANIADANLWTVGGQVTSDDDKLAVLASILQAGGGVPVASAGRISVLISSIKSSVLAIDDADIIDAVEITPTTAFRDRKNTIVPQYREETQSWETIAGEELSPPEYVAADGGEVRSTEIVFGMVQKAAQAHQLAALELTSMRQALTVKLTGKPRLLNVRVGEAVTLTRGGLITGQKMIVIARDFDPRTLGVSLTLRAENDARYAYAMGQSQVAPAPPELNGFDPYDPDAPGAGAWTITGTSLTSSAGVSLPALIITGENDNPNTASIRIEYRRAGDADWTDWGSGSAQTTRFEIRGLEGSATYEAAVSYVTVRAVRSPRLILGPVAIGNPEIPWVGNVITDVPPVLTDLDSNGNIYSNNVSYGNTTVGETLTQLTNRITNAVNATSGVITNLTSQATTFRDWAASNAAATANSATSAAANASASLTSATRAAANATAAQTSALQSAANATAADAFRLQAFANALLSANAATWATSNATTAQTQANTATAQALIATTQATYAAANASFASSNATLASGYRSNALNSATWAQSNAVIASTQAGYAGANATAAQTSAGLAATYQAQASVSAGVAQTQAGYATSNAALATSNATLAATFAGQAQSNASNAQAQAVIASTQAGYATTNASLAMSNATLTATYFSWAQSNAANANVARVSAQAQAIIAATQAGYANDYAALASASNILSAAYAAQASTSANVASQASGWATSNAAFAFSNAALSAVYSGWAQTNAINANGAAVVATSNAIIASTQAGYATANASLAQSNASLSATFASYTTANAAAANTGRVNAVANATIAQQQAGYATSNASLADASRALSVTYAGQAQTNATVAQQQAGYATANAGIALSNATLAAGFAGFASSNSAVANTAALAATANATIASTQRGYADANAALADTARGLAVTYAGQALANAGVAATQAAYASDNATAAQSNLNLTTGYATTARTAAASLLPDDFSNLDLWTSSENGSPATVPGASSAFFTTASDGLTVWQRSSSGSIYLYTRGVIRPTPTAVYEITVDVQCVSKAAGETPEIRPYLSGLAADYTAGINQAPSFTTISTAGSYSVSWRVSLAGGSGITAINAANAFIRPAVNQRSVVSSVLQVRRITVRDVTADLAAADAQSSAAIATTQAAYSAANASSAAASQTLTSGYVAQAAANATLAQTRAGWAQTNATAAASSATFATANAAFAQSNATLSATRAGYAFTNASLAQDFAGYASDNAAAAQSSATLAASAGGGGNALIRNGTLNDFPTSTGVPNLWTQGTGGSGTRVAGENGGGYGYQLAGGAGSNAFMSQRTAAGSVKPGDYFVLEATVKLNSGTFAAAGLVFRTLNTSNATIQDYKLQFLIDDHSGTGGVGTTGEIYRFTKLIQADPAQTAADRADFFVCAHLNSTLGSSAAANNMTFYYVNLRPATAQEIQTGSVVPTLSASVTTLQSAVASVDGKTQAYWSVTTGAGGSKAGIVASATFSGNGVTTSDVGLIANTVSIYNPSSNNTLPALVVSGGQAVFSGQLTSGAGVFVGSAGNRVAVALQAFQRSAIDGGSVSFPNLGAIPSYTFSTANLLPLSTGETYDLTLTSLTATGGTVRAKIITPGTPGAINLTTDAAGSGGPTRVISRGSNAEASTYDYNVTVSGVGTFRYLAVSGREYELSGQVIVAVWAQKSSVWSEVATIIADVQTSFTGSGSGYQTIGVAYEVSDTIQMGSGVTSFGVSMKSTTCYSATVTDLDSVAWTTGGTASGTRTALASGAKAIITFVPRNGA